MAFKIITKKRKQATYSKYHPSWLTSPGAGSVLPGITDAGFNLLLTGR